MEISNASASRSRPSAKRRPLGDLTNSSSATGGSPPLSSSSALLGSYSLRSGLRNVKKPAAKLHEVSPNLSGKAGSTGSRKFEEDLIGKEAEQIPKSSEVLPQEENSKFAVGNAQQSRERRTKKRKHDAALVHSSCPPVGRTRNMGLVGDRMEGIHERVLEPKSCMIPLKPKKRKLHKTTITNPGLEEDLMKQRAYFAEIDADELIEEVASDSE